MIVAVKHIIQEIIKRCGVFCRILQYGECSLMRNISETRENNWIFIKEGCRGKGWKWCYLNTQKQCYPFRLAFSQNTSKIGRISEKKEWKNLSTVAVFWQYRAQVKYNIVIVIYLKSLPEYSHIHTQISQFLKKIFTVPIFQLHRCV